MSYTVCNIRNMGNTPLTLTGEAIVLVCLRIDATVVCAGAGVPSVDANHRTVSAPPQACLNRVSAKGLS